MGAGALRVTRVHVLSALRILVWVRHACVECSARFIHSSIHSFGHSRLRCSYIACMLVCLPTSSCPCVDAARGACRVSRVPGTAATCLTCGTRRTGGLGRSSPPRPHGEGGMYSMYVCTRAHPAAGARCITASSPHHHRIVTAPPRHHRVTTASPPHPVPPPRGHRIACHHCTAGGSSSRSSWTTSCSSRRGARATRGTTTARNS